MGGAGGGGGPGGGGGGDGGIGMPNAWISAKWRQVRGSPFLTSVTY